MTNKALFLVACACSLAVAGCGLWHETPNTGIAAPGAWQNAETEAEAIWPENDWWQQFDSPALSAMVEDAAAHNFDLAAAVARVQQADAEAQIAGASLLPEIGLGGSAARNRTSGNSRSASALGITSRPRLSNAYSASASASYELDFWGKNRSASDAADALAEASRYDRETVALTVATSIANNYFALLGTQERLVLARNNLAAAEQLLEAIRQRFDAGINSGLDVARQETLVENQRAVIPQLEEQLQRQRSAQAILLGKMPGDFSTPTETLADMNAPTVVPGLPSQLLQRRPDVQNALARLAASDADVTAAEAAFLPSISLTGESGYESNALSALLRPDSMFFSLAGSLTQPLFDGGRLRGQKNAAEGRYNEALAEYRKAAFSAFSDVEDALVTHRQAVAAEQTRLAALVAAQKAYDLNKELLESGATDITAVLETQRALFSAQDALIQAKLAHLQSIVGLYKALGGGWKNENHSESEASLNRA